MINNALGDFGKNLSASLERAVDPMYRKSIVKPCQLILRGTGAVLQAAESAIRIRSIHTFNIDIGVA